MIRLRAAGFATDPPALTNVVKHAGPGTRVQVRVAWRPGDLTVEVVDDQRERLRQRPRAPRQLDARRRVVGALHDVCIVFVHRRFVRPRGDTNRTSKVCVLEFVDRHFPIDRRRW